MPLMWCITSARNKDGMSKETCETEITKSIFLHRRGNAYHVIRRTAMAANGYIGHGGGAAKSENFPRTPNPHWP